jgi:hypothetical protein
VTRAEDSAKGVRKGSALALHKATHTSMIRPRSRNSRYELDATHSNHSRCRCRLVVYRLVFRWRLEASHSNSRSRGLSWRSVKRTSRSDSMLDSEPRSGISGTMVSMRLRTRSCRRLVAMRKRYERVCYSSTTGCLHMRWRPVQNDRSQVAARHGIHGKNRGPRSAAYAVR